MLGSEPVVVRPIGGLEPAEPVVATHPAGRHGERDHRRGRAERGPLQVHPTGAIEEQADPVVARVMGGLEAKPRLQRGVIEREAEPLGGAGKAFEVAARPDDPAGRCPHRLQEGERRARRAEDAGLGIRLGVFGPGIRTPGDPAAGAVLHGPRGAIHHRRADRHVEPGSRPLPGRSEQADGAAVDAPGTRLEPIDDPHGRRLRCPGDRSARERRREQVDEFDARPRPAGHRGGQLPHRLVPFEREQLGHADRADLRDARQVVAQQVDDHDVLGPVLGRGQQVGGGVVVGGPVVATGRRALHRPAGGRVVVPLDEQLRRRRADGPAAEVDECVIPTALRPRQGGVQREGIAGERPDEPVGEVDLIGVPLLDLGPDGVDPPAVPVAPGDAPEVVDGDVGSRRLVDTGHVAPVPEHTEPGERQAIGWPADREGTIEGGAGLVGEEPGDPGPSSGGRFCRQHHSPDLVEPTGDEFVGPVLEHERAAGDHVVEPDRADV